MELRSSTVSAFFDDLKTEFNNAYTSASPVWPQLAMKVTSNSEVNVYGWMEQMPQFREWIGTRVFHNIKSNGYTLTNKPWEWSMAVDALKLKYDQYGIYSPLTATAGKNAASFPDLQVFGLLNNGFVTTYGACWDGKAFFAADHPWKPDENGDATTLNNVSNLALTDTNYNTILAAFKQNLQGGDNPFFPGTPEILLVCGTALENTAKKILQADYDQLGATNVNKGTAELLVHAQITGNYWFLILKNNPIMPFIYQEFQAVDVETNEGSVDIKETRQYKIMADMVGAYGYSLPALAYGSTGSASE